jgi:hypothetical protein
MRPVFFAIVFGLAVGCHARKSDYDSFMRAGKEMNIPVTFTNGCFFMGKKTDDATSAQKVPDENADPFE